MSAPVLAPQIDALTHSLFVGVALAITAVPILGRIMREFGLTRTETGVVAISAAAINDVVGWVLLAGVSAYAASRLSAGAMVLQVAGLAALAAVLWFLLRPAVDRLLPWMPIVAGEMPANLLASVLCLMFVMGICTWQLGIFGGFAAGLLFHNHRGFVEA